MASRNTTTIKISSKNLPPPSAQPNDVPRAPGIPIVEVVDSSDDDDVNNNNNNNNNNTHTQPNSSHRPGSQTFSNSDDDQNRNRDRTRHDVSRDDRDRDRFTASGPPPLSRRGPELASHMYPPGPPPTDPRFSSAASAAGPRLHSPAPSSTRSSETPQPGSSAVPYVNGSELSSMSASPAMGAGGILYPPGAPGHAPPQGPGAQAYGMPPPGPHAGPGGMMGPAAMGGYPGQMGPGMMGMPPGYGMYGQQHGMGPPGQQPGVYGMMHGGMMGMGHQQFNQPGMYGAAPPPTSALGPAGPPSAGYPYGYHHYQQQQQPYGAGPAGGTAGMIPPPPPMGATGVTGAFDPFTAYAHLAEAQWTEPFIAQVYAHGSLEALRARNPQRYAQWSDNPRQFVASLVVAADGGGSSTADQQLVDKRTVCVRHTQGFRCFLFAGADREDGLVDGEHDVVFGDGVSKEAAFRAAALHALAVIPR